MRTRTALMTRVGVPALAGAVLALVLALISGLGTIAGGTVGMGAGLAPEYEAVKEIGADAGFLRQGDAATSNRGDGASSEVRYGNLSLEVDDVDDALARVTAIAEAAGGYISSSSRSGEGENLYLSLTLRLPAAQFTDVMASLRDEGDVVYEDFGSYDVTMQVLDLEARLENLRASERAFLDLLDRSQTVADIVAVQTELSRIQGDIESYEAQLGAVKDQVEMASINVSLMLPVSPVDQASGDFDLGYEISSALANLINVGRAVIVAAINIVVIGVPIAIVGALFGSVIGRTLSAIVVWVRRSLGGASKSARRAARR